jgi:prepilin-type N-terminal cleavage/methylation domain-containing protein
MKVRQRPSSRSRGFTLVEVLATMALMGIALPVLMEGLSVATNCAQVARQRTEAAALAESQLNEIVAAGNFTTGASDSGDFGADWPEYHWQSVVQDWTQSGLEQIDLHVTWKARTDREIVVSTLVYNNANANTSGSSGTSATGTSGAGSGSGSGSGKGSGSGGSGSKSGSGSSK